MSLPLLTPAPFAASKALKLPPKITCVPLPLPKFKVGDRVFWFRVPTQDFGVVRDRFYGLEGSVKAEGWHYKIKLDPQSPSFPHCKEDYGFEDDLEYLK